MKSSRKRNVLTVSVCLIFYMVTVSSSIAANVNKMTKEELIEIMDRHSVSILDVRQERDWSSSEFKIKGADRVDPDQFDMWANHYPKNKTLVLYCA